MAGVERVDGEGAPPDLAVVVVNYNSGAFLGRCLRSAFEAAGDARLEVVVVDNASTDGSLEAARGLPGVRVVRNRTNRGFAAAANQGIQATSAPFVLLLNPDAQVLAGTLGGLLKVARDHPRAGAIGPLVRAPDGRVYPSARRVPSLGVGLVHAFLGVFWPDNRFSRAYTMADWDRRSSRSVEWVSGCCMLLRREALDEVGLFDEGYFMYVEDVDLCTRLRLAGWDVLFTPELEVLHVQGVSTRGSKRMTLEHSRSIYRYFVKFGSPGWRAVLRPLAWVALRARAELVSRARGER
ncbi:MAG TPA: glycosyltransferase family 2 protein [Actinomycetota bacterium]|nr:glycosyltransferase family 2 protein [Actinomycetota bacterium]